MFENVIGQSAVLQLSRDISGGRLAPAMLFQGPRASGKGTAALELARVISCENEPGGAAWNCVCSSCARHRLLLHPDLLCVGSRPFSSEIAASKEAFLRDSAASAARALFFRSVRKLLARFSPVLWEDESKLSKLNPIVSSIEEGLDLLEALDAGRTEKEKIEKAAAAIVKDTLKLEGEGMSDSVPVAQLRRASAWTHLLPSGKGKTLIIENADRMQEGSRNSLLKLLEEPPRFVTIIMISERPGALLPTIRSRLRPYVFSSRGGEAEREVIRRVFRNENPALPLNAESGALISSYLDGFLPVSADTLDKLAAFFAASAAKKAALLIREKGRELPEIVVSLGSRAAKAAEEAAPGRPVEENREAVAAVLKGASNFEVRSLFARFLAALLAHVSEGARRVSVPAPEDLLCMELWKDCAGRAGSAVSIYNQSPTPALERLFTEASRGMAELCGSL